MVSTIHSQIPVVSSRPRPAGRYLPSCKLTCLRDHLTCLRSRLISLRASPARWRAATDGMSDAEPALMLKDAAATGTADAGMVCWDHRPIRYKDHLSRYRDSHNIDKTVSGLRTVLSLLWESLYRWDVIFILRCCMNVFIKCHWAQDKWPLFFTVHFLLNGNGMFWSNFTELPNCLIDNKLAFVLIVVQQIMA